MTTVTILMYSGVPNPTFELTEAQEVQLQNELAKVNAKTFQQSPSSSGLLGYRGFEVHSNSEVETSMPQKMLIFDGIGDIGETDEANFVDEDSNLESMMLEFAEGSITKEERAYISETIKKNSLGGIASTLSDFDLVVPPLNLGKWNNNPVVKRNNNCYNYANDKITNTFAQPGRGSGVTGPFPPTCSGTGSAAERDGQVRVSSASSTPSQGHFIALVVWPGRDYHWYRLDSNGLWSHKPGSTAARNTDNSGRLISSPETCNRGPYSVWCGYYHCIPANTRIR